MKKRSLMIKITSALIVFVAVFFFIIGTIETSHVFGYDFEASSAWMGEDLGFNQLDNINYDSPYVPFSDIIDPIDPIDESKIYVIETAVDLYFFSLRAKGPDRLIYLRLDYVLGNDINYYDAVTQNANYRFNPVGFTDPFIGTFDGQGFEITNLFFRPINTSTEYELEFAGLRYYAMFSRVGAAGVVKNFGVINPIMLQPIEWGVMQHAAVIAGENNGLVSHVYYRDTRGNNSGLAVEGFFHISGLVAVNNGTLSDSYVATTLVKSIQVIDNLSQQPITYFSPGTIERVYYDDLLFLDETTPQTIGIPIDTFDFQDALYFSGLWYLNDQYLPLMTQPSQEPQVLQNRTYPILKGLDVSDGKLLIDSAADMVFMNTLLKYSNFFRSQHYVIDQDIDMRQVASDAYIAANIGFRGILSGSIVRLDSTLYDRNINQGGDIDRHTLLNLNISRATEVGNFASYGLFSSLFGRVEHLNIAHAIIHPTDMGLMLNKTKILVGILTGQSNLAHVNNVHVLGNYTLPDQAGTPGQIIVGGLIGEGTANISLSSTNGSIAIGSYTYQSRNNLSALGGIIGKSTQVVFSHVLNHMDLTGMSYHAENDATLYMGGLLGYGQVVSMDRVVNRGNLMSHQTTGFIDFIYMGGIIGEQIKLIEHTEFVYNRGDLTLNITSPTQARVAGYGHIQGGLTIENNFEYISLTNNGIISIANPNGITLSQSELEAQDIVIASVLLTDQVELNAQGLFNMRSQTIDLSMISSYAGVANIKNTVTSSVIQAYNTGNLNFVTTHPMVQTNMMISGNILGQHLTLEHLRNEGNISVDLLHNNLNPGDLNIVGLFEETSQDHITKNGFNGGDITITKGISTTITYDIYASGISHRNLNTNFYQNNQINPASINFTPTEGPFDHFINDGDLTIEGNFHGSTRLSGVVMFNHSMITTSFNLGLIKNINHVQVADKEVESAGIAYLMIGGYAQIRDAANYGDIQSISETALGYSHAAGIALRNDRLEDGQTALPQALHAQAKIIFTINYGDIYAWNGLDESTFTIVDETRTKASGILAMGLLSTINNMNYGGIYARYLAGGIIAFVDLPKFGNLGFNLVYVGNDINYGQIRAITAYDSNTQAVTVLHNSLPMRTSFNGYGAIFGKFHTGTTMWDFLSVSPTSQYPFDQINFGYAFNFDELNHMFDSAPMVTIDPSLPQNDGQGNDIVLAIVNRMSTTNPNDQSAAPFRAQTLGNFPQTAVYGRQIVSYLPDASEDGIFNADFVLRRAPLSSQGTDRYLRDFIEYIPRDQANLFLLDQLELYTMTEYPGLYALSSSKGIGNGIFIPDHFELERLHPHTLSEGPTFDWLGDGIDPNSVMFKLTTGMRQIESAFASSIYDLEILQTDALGQPIANGLVLKSPEIDRERKIVTYYLPSNAEVLNQTTVDFRDVYSFIETSEGLGNKVPDKLEDGIWSYKWVGDYKKDGIFYVPIGPYNTSGIHNITFSTSMQNSKGGINSNVVDTPVYNRVAVDSDSTMQTFVHVHRPHIQVSVGNNFRWEQDGYVTQNVSTVAPGYGAYKTFTFQAPPFYATLYEYVGPSQEAVTYIETDVIPNTPIYTDAGIYFKANLDPESYSISDTASLTYNGQSDLELATIPLSYGIYDVMYDALTDDFIDAIEVHYGSVRVYAESYVPGDPQTFQDYQIRIIRSQPETITDLEALMVNGINAKPLSIPNLNEVTTSELIHYSKDGDLGTMQITYETENTPDGFNVLPLIRLYDVDTNTEIDPSLYHLREGTAITDGAFNNLTGAWGRGEVTVLFEVTDRMPTAFYRLELTLFSGETFSIIFEKLESANKDVLLISWNGKDIVPKGNMHESMIPYGLYYDELNQETWKVNFSNLEDLVDIYEPLLSGANIPSYLNDFVISPFATIKSIDLVITPIDGYRYQYDIIYDLEAEDLSRQTFTHRLTEYPLTPDFEAVYVDGGQRDLPLELIIIPFESSPTIRVEYQTSLIFVPFDNIIDITSVFTPGDLGEESFEGVDYFVNILPGLGYEVDFNQLIGIGTYTFEAAYANTVDLWGETFTWSYTFTSVSAEKVKNDNSHLDEIVFISETVFAGFDTIIDYQFMTPEDYIGYIENPVTRPIVTIPGIGISYNEYITESTYWVIGQVQRTNLTFYQPEFILPFGASIYRVIDSENIGYEFQSSQLAADFSPMGIDVAFNYIHYRVYAQDYDDNPLNYTDYFIAVQDVTNNVRFEIIVENTSMTQIDRVFVTMLGCNIAIDYVGECDYEQYHRMMSLFSYYDELSDSYINNGFAATTFGTYKVLADLPYGFDYYILLQDTLIDGTIFYVEDSIVPRRYRVTVQIYDTLAEKPWGKEENIRLEPNRLDYQFSYLNPMSFTRSGTWLSSNQGFSTSFGSLFVDAPGRSYEMTLKAKMTQSNDTGAYLLLFDTTLSGLFDDGYAINFNRTNNRIELIERTSGANGNIIESVNHSDFAWLPLVSSDPWWMLEHSITLKVDIDTVSTNSISIWIDDVLIMEDIIVDDLNGSLAGIRSIGVVSIFNRLTIDIFE
ncbi:MAG: hypothetical protein ACNA7K_02505 [Acholeplasmataceae bacterium]